jgi:branched-chain amino acid transport system substrate-binding protein
MTDLLSSRRRYLAIASASILTLALAACGGDAAGSDTKGDAVRLGVVTSLTGPLSQSGKEVKEGFDLAVSTINADGGVLGKKLETVVEDDKSSPEQAVIAARKVVGQGVDVLGGTITTPLAIAISQSMINSPDKMFVMTAATTNQPLQAQKHGNIFGLSATSASFGQAYFPFIAKQGAKRLAVVAAKGDYGDNELKAIAAAGSFQPVAVERFEMTQSDFSGAIAKIKSVKADAVFFTSAGTSVQPEFAKQARQLGLSVPLYINAMSLVDEQLSQAAGALDGAHGVDLYNPTLDNPANAAFVKAFVAAHDRNPTTLNEFGYETAFLVAAAMKKAGTTTDVAKITASLRDGTFQTPRGEVTFSDIQRSEVKPFVVVVQGDAIEPVNGG